MNYRHAYHAGNFADVVKHVVLCLAIQALKRKPKAFRVIDTHAGRGRYDLAGDEALRTGEATGGVLALEGQLQRFNDAGVDAGSGSFEPDTETASPSALPPDEGLRLYAQALDAARAWRTPAAPDTAPRFYPGSPLIARVLLRPQDRLIANELHPEDAAALRHLFARDPQSKTMAIDGWTALKAVLPPPERRAVVLIDPPYERTDDLPRMARALAQALKRFATGIYLLWYPIKDPDTLRPYRQQLAATVTQPTATLEFFHHAGRRADKLNGCGLTIVNPPYQLEDALTAVMPTLTAHLETVTGQGTWTYEPLSG
ncbi:MAG: 23S rRNA (adenine(2030)-N(6))-methyltransferase RlmJ [Pseudomonadota bacterium]